MRPWTRVAPRALLAMILAGSVALGSGTPATVASPERNGEPTACSPVPEPTEADTEGMLPVQSVAQGNVHDHGPPRSLLLVSTRPDSIPAVIDPADAATVASVDLSAHVLVALFIGRWPQEGHRVTIQSVRTTDAGVCLTALVARPEPGQDAADAEKYPYHVVSVPLAALPQVQGTIWTAVSPDGTPIATTRWP